MNSHAYNAIAAVLNYPGTDYSAALEALHHGMPEECRAQLAGCAAALGALSLMEQQELFTRTFDLNPVCSPELGWHLFGENYERGLLLVRLREELRAKGIPESGELPDHLTCALRLLARMEHGCAADFASAILLPALAKMVKAIGGKCNPFEHLLRSVSVLISTDFPELPVPQPSVDLPVLPEEVAL